jgi:hypothetical protein
MTAPAAAARPWGGVIRHICPKKAGHIGRDTEYASKDGVMMIFDGGRDGCCP